METSGFPVWLLPLSRLESHKLLFLNHTLGKRVFPFLLLLLFFGSRSLKVTIVRTGPVQAEPGWAKLIGLQQKFSLRQVKSRFSKYLSARDPSAQHVGCLFNSITAFGFVSSVPIQGMQYPQTTCQVVSALRFLSYGAHFSEQPGGLWTGVVLDQSGEELKLLPPLSKQGG